MRAQHAHISVKLTNETNSHDVIINVKPNENLKKFDTIKNFNF